jgi:hypothetical protein
MTYEHLDMRQYCTETASTNYVDMSGDVPQQFSTTKVKAGRCDGS